MNSFPFAHYFFSPLFTSYCVSNWREIEELSYSSLEPEWGAGHQTWTHCCNFKNVASQSQNTTIIKEYIM